MKLTGCRIAGVFVVEPDVFRDERGYFTETYSRRRLEEAYMEAFGRPFGTEFVQDNESMSSYGVVRGLHFQRGQAAQAKLVRVISGEVLDVAVDLRRGSETFGQYFSVLLTGDNKKQLFVPRGFAHGFAVLSPEAVFQYKCDNFYDPSAEGGIAWNDPDIGIDWGLPDGAAVLSAKDRQRPLLRDCGNDLF